MRTKGLTFVEAAVEISFIALQEKEGRRTTMLDGVERAMTQFDVHPAAAVLPMMSEDELNDLAADIEAHGLLHPIVLDADGELLIDGRNRLEGCYRAGVEPQFRRLNGEDDHLAFIASANLNRRNLTKGQKAMA